MSDFDEEAERERLREQYEREQQKREATEHMSELLLKGATMTDAHCEECGDPIFRYDGQTFCPTCKQEVDPEDTEEPSEDDSGAESPAGASNEERSDAESGTEQLSADAGAAIDNANSGRAPTTASGREKSETGDNATVPSTAGRVEVPAVEPEGGADSPRDGRETTGSLEDARNSLQRTLLSFARQAESTDDPRRARDALEAAREAADTLAAIDKIR
ncbi:Sjogren's syndrome/scleroderma autoantigen 1 family protein [Halorhabdus rudnickae]|uniref:Sjogren's syndrome/scleroderma autoantigen 1 family protein n=1 Tax=Halorhabdus rudnickae TaxID=1775544 RepID=UPI0010840747|nr:Sjogren's syndrome/scleroderma autoantigen 1 family protein [Halorhabdus rudnickae]